ncbi:MAG: ATP-binding protein [Spirochaetota bacterium]|nr:ATP-binding protein [Spirochaetota bacterium]
MNYPFISGKFVTGNDFCGRKEELSILKTHINSNGRVCLIGERRVGKSSLIHECVRQISEKKILYIDFWTVRNIDDVCKKILQGIISYEKKQSFLIKIIKQFSYLRPTFSFDQNTGQANIGFSSDSPKMTVASLEELLDLIESLTKHVVVFDEFQDVAQISENEKVFATMRSKIQSHTKIPYIFAGSIRNKMIDIFTDYKSPFYKTAICMNIHPIKRGLFVEFIVKRFSKNGKRKVSSEVVNYIFDLCYEIPGDIQQLCIYTWMESEENSEISEETVKIALLNMFSMLKSSYEKIYDSLSNQQILFIKTLSLCHDGSSNISKKFLRLSQIDLTQSAAKAANSLIKKKIILKENKIYRFSDPFFKEWVKSLN